MKIKFLGAIVLGAALSPLASAATLDFGTTGGSNCAASGCNFGFASVGVAASAGVVNQGAYGLGVFKDSTDSTALDNYYAGATKEALTFTFSTAVTLDSIELGLWESADKNHSFYTINGGTAVRFNSTNNLFTVGQQVTTLVISTDTRGAIGNTDFRVNKLNVSAVVVPEVPLPAAAWLFGSALLGLGVVKRRKA